MSRSSRPFGQRLYEELRRSQGTHGFITTRMDYADIQRLKAADREEVVKMFRGSGYAFVQRLKQDEPEELARFLAAEALAAQRAAGAIAFIVFLGLAVC